MANHNSLAALFQDTADAIRRATGMGGSIVADNFPSAISGIPFPAWLDSREITTYYSGNRQLNIITNDRVRIAGSDRKLYTVKEWNDLFRAAGYDKTQMGIEPIGVSVGAFDNLYDECLLFNKFTGTLYNVRGATALTANSMSHSHYTQPYGGLNAGSGTDTTTGKSWTITVIDDDLELYEANTKRTWRFENVYISTPHNLSDVQKLTYKYWAITEWLRHRFAISSGVTTTKANGTMGEVAIYNSSGTQAAVGEDMYFWVKNDSDVFVNTNILAKYNLTNKHNDTTALLTQAIADNIYASQKANGVDMNDTGVNSVSKPILAPGSKGAELIAVDGYWFIITPMISNPNTNTGVNYNVADAPAVYWAIHNNCGLPSVRHLLAVSFNSDLVNEVIRYLNTAEGRGVPTLPSSGYIWTSVKYSAANYTWEVQMIGTMVGYSSYNYNRNLVYGAIELNRA